MPPSSPAFFARVPPLLCGFACCFCQDSSHTKTVLHYPRKKKCISIGKFSASLRKIWECFSHYFLYLFLIATNKLLHLSLHIGIKAQLRKQSSWTAVLRSKLGSYCYTNSFVFKSALEGGERRENSGSLCLLDSLSYPNCITNKWA